jgi:2-amino-4-hydroxy-6-hydroxymethyldihydropteridine diphosphokinase
MAWSRAYIGLGANLGDPVAQMERALTALAAQPTVRRLRRSSYYRTRPWGPVAQDDFINAVAAIDTLLTPVALMTQLLRIERSLGRIRGERYGPRLIDLDLLLFGALQVRSPHLEVPHPRLAERAFVLMPLLELDDSIVLPDAGLAREALARLPDSARADVIRLDPVLTVAVTAV